MGHIDAMRIGADVEAVWQYRSLLWLTGLRSFPSLENALQNVITRAALHRRWWINDPDCLLIRNSRSRLSNAELVTATTVLAMAGGMLMLSDDLPAVPSERLGLALRAIPPTDRSPFIPDLFIREQPSFLRAEQPWGGWLISQINWESSDVRSEPNVQVWGIDPNLFVRVIDVHRGVDLGMCRGQLPQTHLMPHGCILYSLSTLPHAIPKLLACDLHWGGGPETAITTTWNAPNLELKINFELHGRRTGKFFVGYPSRFRVEAIHAANGSIDHIDNSPDQLLVCDVTMSGPAACWVNFSASTDTGTHL